MCDPVCSWESLCGCQSVLIPGVMYTVFWPGLEGWTWCSHVPRMLLMVAKSVPLIRKVRGLGMQFRIRVLAQQMQDSSALHQCLVKEEHVRTDGSGTS